MIVILHVLNLDFLRIYTVSQKVVHQTHSDNFVNCMRIFKILSLLEREVNFQQNHIILSTIPSVCCHTTLRKLEV